MIDIVHFRENSEAYAEACRKKRIKFDVSAFLEIDKKFRQSKGELEALRAEQNAFSKEIAKLSGPDKQAKLERMKVLAAELKEKGEQFKSLEEEYTRKILLIPSIPAARVPIGDSDKDNVEIRRWGDIRKFDFTPKSHVELGKALDILDIERGVKIAGARSYFLKGDGARLHHAVLRFAMDLLTDRGFTIMDVPHIVKWEAMMGTGYFPGGEEQAYHLDDRDKEFHLIGTSEVSAAAYHMDEILQLSELPKRYAGYSPCYRREAGTYGKDAAGVYRIHQFYKVEQVVICKNDPEESARIHAEILGNSEAVLQALNLPYRVVDVCTGDMGQGQVYKNDIETWMPSRNGYGETHSCSTLHEFQARRLNTRYKDENGKNLFCHTLNNTCIASPRALIPILELNQNADGSVTVPEALRPYMGGKELIKAR